MRLVKWEEVVNGELEVMLNERWYRYSHSEGGWTYMVSVDGPPPATHKINNLQLHKILDNGYTRVEAFRTATKVEATT